MFKFLKLILIAIFFLSYNANAQSDSSKVRSVISLFFSSMKSSDTSLLRTTIHPKCQLITIKKNGIIESETISSLLNQIAKSPKNSLDERIEFGSIVIDSNLAVLTTPYQFYYQEKFSHCGMNSFQLVKVKNEWFIFTIADTRRKADCK